LRYLDTAHLQAWTELKERFPHSINPQAIWTPRCPNWLYD
jgi:hypothetical protein